MTITSTSLKHPKIQWELEAACIRAIQMSKITTCNLGWSFATSTKDKTICHVRHSRKENSLSSLDFYDANMTNITNVVLKALRSF